MLLLLLKVLHVLLKVCVDTSGGLARERILVSSPAANVRLERVSSRLQKALNDISRALLSRFH